jgi:hypothetical protein
MKSYEAAATIAADPATVWQVLTDAAGYPSWDSGVVRVEGGIEEGAKIKVFSTISPKRAFPVIVTELEANRRMVWSGGMPMGLFKGVRTFTLTPTDGGTVLTMREEFTGPLLPLIWRTMPDLQPSFDQFAAGLKQRAEAGASGR